MTKTDYLDKVLSNVLNDRGTKAETLRKLYGRTRLFDLSDIDKAWEEGRKSKTNS